MYISFVILSEMKIPTKIWLALSAVHYYIKLGFYIKKRQKLPRHMKFLSRNT